jgi:hypothetical protein
MREYQPSNRERQMNSQTTEFTRQYYNFQCLEVGSYFRLLNQEDLFQKVRFISSINEDREENFFDWTVMAIKVDDGMGCYLKDDTITKKIDVAQAIRILN